MDKREKVMAGMEHHFDHACIEGCRGCPYYKSGDDDGYICWNEMLMDAYTLLKEERSAGSVMVFRDDGELDGQVSLEDLEAGVYPVDAEQSNYPVTPYREGGQYV